MANRREWTDKEVQEEIKSAVQIVQEDRERAQYASLHERFGKEPGSSEPPQDGKTPPPPKDDGGEPPPVTSKSIWWPKGAFDE